MFFNDRSQGAEKLMVVFDRACDMHKTDILKFFKDVRMSEGIGTFTGRGPSGFPPTVIDSDHFWLR